MPTALRAQQVPPTCDADYMDVLSNRAWMEGKRQFEMAQKLILKQDSTLQYVCLGQRLQELHSPGADWSNRKANMQAKLNVLVAGPMNTYLNSNFNHSMGGGTSSIGGGPCDTMNRIWQFLKCRDFDINDFMTFNQLSGSDPRRLYRACNKQQRNQNWRDAIEAAFPTPSTPAANGGMNDLVTFIGLLQTQCSRSMPVPTGVWIRNNDGSTYEEHTCLPPGCSWTPGDTYCH